MKAFKVTTKTQAFVVTSETMAAVCAAYSGCDDLESISFLGDVVSLPEKLDETKYVPFEGPLTEAAKQ